MSDKKEGKRAVRKPTLDGLPGDYVLSSEIRGACGLAILTAKAREWSSIETLVDDYFQNVNTWSSSYMDMHTQLLDGLGRLEKSSERPLVKSYAKEVRSFLQAPYIVQSFEKYYRLKERMATQRQEALLARIEGNISGAVLSQRGAKRLLEQDNDQPSPSSSRQRVSLADVTNNRDADVSSVNQDEPYSESNTQSEDHEQPLHDPTVIKDQFSFVSNGKRFDYFTPSKNLASQKTPALPLSDHCALSNLFEIRLSSGSPGCCSHETEALYEKYRNEQQLNSKIKACPGAMELLNTALEPANFLDTRKLWSWPEQGNFLDMMRYILGDYYQTCRRASPINVNNERTFFCECIVPIFKHFSVMVGSISGEWCEKQMAESRRVWLPLSNYQASGISRKLHDGILANQAETVAVIIESSGLTCSSKSSEANTSHIIDDTYKQLKSTSDFLKHLSSKYSMCSMQTLIKIKVPCVTVISNRLTLCLATIQSNSKWRFVEARSCIIPTIAKEKKAWIKAFEFLACLEDVVKSSLETIEQLEDEALGYTTLSPDEILVRDYLI
ncbi:hypothetical protein MBANPS3_000357 [Mucor bainieri]